MNDFLFSFNNKQSSIKFTQNCIIFGSNESGKTTLLQILKKGLDGTTKNNFYMNSLKVNKDENTVIYFDEETDFNNEFKFSNSNVFRNGIYESVEKGINTEQILKDLNSVLDSIDIKVNQYIHSTFNKYFDNNINFDINITNLDHIINKFTDIYIDGLTNDKQLSKSKKRILIYQLILLNLVKNNDTYILIDDFDLYLDTDNIISILNFMSKLSKETNCHFIITTSNPNVYSLINSSFCCYKLNKSGDIISIDYNLLKDISIKSLLTIEAKKNSIKQDYDKFIENNLFLISNEDIKNFFDKTLPFYKLGIGLILTSDYILLASTNNLFNSTFILCRDFIELEFYKYLCDKLLTDCDIADMI